MKLKKIDILIAEHRRVLVDYGRTLGGYRIIQCPFCFTQSSIYARNLIKGARCHNPDCRALLKGSDAFRDMVPATLHPGDTTQGDMTTMNSRSFNPPPWKLDGDVIRDASGGVVISAFNPCNTAVRKMIVESVNTLAALKEAGDKLGRYYTPEAILANPPWKEGEIEVFTLKSFEQLRDLLRRVAPFVAEAEAAWRKVAATKPEDIAFTAEEDKAKLICDAEKHHAEIVSALREVRETLGEDK